MKLNILRVFLAAIVLCLTVQSIERTLDYHYRKPVDLRNRQIGSRMIADGKSPYFDTWKPGQPMRYYDMFHSYVDSASTVTASPIFLQALTPLGEMDYYDASVIWMGVQFICLFFIGWVFWRMSKTEWQKWLVALVTALFTYSNPWKMHTLGGQVYIIYAAVFAAIYLLYAQKTKWAFIATGILAAMLVAIRPNTVLFFVPLVIFVRNKYFIASMGIIGSLFLLWILLSPFQQRLWKDYTASIKYHSYWHQATITGEKIKGKGDDFAMGNYEGYTQSMVNAARAKFSFPYWESANVYIVYNLMFKKPMSIQLMNVLNIAGLIFMLALFWWVQRGDAMNQLQVFCAAAALYMYNQFLLPIPLISYPGVQMLPFILAIFAYDKIGKIKWAAVAVAIGLYLSIVYVQMVKLPHSLAEYIVALSCFLIVCSGSKHNFQKFFKRQAAIEK